MTRDKGGSPSHRLARALRCVSLRVPWVYLQAHLTPFSSRRFLLIRRCHVVRESSRPESLAHAGGRRSHLAVVKPRLTGQAPSASTAPKGSREKTITKRAQGGTRACDGVCVDKKLRWMSSGLKKHMRVWIGARDSNAFYLILRCRRQRTLRPLLMSWYARLGRTRVRVESGWRRA
jgi:hypothetical protein